MGEYADEYLEKEIEETGRRLAREEEESSRARRLHENLTSLAETERGLAQLGLGLRRRTRYHYHILQKGKVVAQWYPSTGTTMYKQFKGKRCTTGPQLIDWIRRQIASPNKIIK